jgi:hypothetical protein
VLIAGVPTVAKAAAAASSTAASSTVAGTSVALSVLGAFDGGESNLKYYWATTSLPAGASLPVLSASGTNGAKNTTVTFKAAGVYTFTATIFDPGDRYVTSSVTVTVNQTLISISVSPSTASILTDATQQFGVNGIDQFGAAMATLPTITWATSKGTISSAGLLTAPGLFGAATVTAAYGSMKSTASVTIVDQPPTVATPAAAASSSVTGTAVQLSVLGADDAGESNLKYTWTTTSLPSGVAAPVFGANGTNAAKNTTVAFKAAGAYTFTATITDSGNLSVTSSVTVTVTAALSQIVVTPGNYFVVVGNTQQYTASGLDQFGNALTVQPSFTWSAAVGTITAGGLLTAPATAGSDTVTVTSGTVTGSTGVTYVTTAFLGLKDTSLADLTESLDADGSLSRLDMIQILQSVTVGGNALSATDFADLQTIVADAATLHMPGYVQVLAADVVDGNTANANYQGQALGDLAAGSSAAQLNDLVDKWFFGSDLPDPGDSAIVYEPTAGTLFDHGGNTPVIADEFQGALGDCYFISSLGSIAKSNPAAITNMFINNGDGTYTVRFYANSTPDYVTVNSMLPTYEGRLIFADYGASYTSASNDLWIPLAEKAYAQWNETGNEGRDGTNTYAGIAGGWMADVDAQVLGHAAASYYPTTSNQQTMIAALAANEAVTMGTIVSPNSDDSLAGGLYGCHAYAVTGYNASSKTFTLYNPWGFDQPSQLSWTQLVANTDDFTVANTSGTVPISAPVSVPVMSGMPALGPAMSQAPAADTPAISPTISAAGEQGRSSSGSEALQARDAWFAAQAGDGGDAATGLARTALRASQSSPTPARLSLLASDAFFQEAAGPRVDLADLASPVAPADR